MACRLIFPVLIASIFFASQSKADLFLNEILASTTGADTEFIEIFNSGPTTIDLSGFEIRHYESDDTGTFGDLEETNVIPGAVGSGTHEIAAGEYFVIGNAAFETAFGFTSDFTTNLSIENSSVTLELFNTNTMMSEYIAYMTDGGAGDMANIGGTAATPDISVGPDGTFFPAGYYLNGDGASTASILEFSPTPAASATPGAANVPEPGSLAVIGLMGLVALTTRRKS